MTAAEALLRNKNTAPLGEALPLAKVMGGIVVGSTHRFGPLPPLQSCARGWRDLPQRALLIAQPQRRREAAVGSAMDAPTALSAVVTALRGGRLCSLMVAKTKTKAWASAISITAGVATTVLVVPLPHDSPPTGMCGRATSAQPPTTPSPPPPSQCLGASAEPPMGAAAAASSAAVVPAATAPPSASSARATCGGSCSTPCACRAWRSYQW